MILYRGLEDGKEIFNNENNYSNYLKEILFFADNIEIAQKFGNNIIKIDIDQKDIINFEDFDKIFSLFEYKYNELNERIKKRGQNRKKIEEEMLILENKITLPLKEKLELIGKKALKQEYDENNWEYLIPKKYYNLLKL